jgi:hypothetical protein
MYRLFGGFGVSGSIATTNALAELVEEGDTSQVPVMIEMMRFLPSVNSREQTAEALRSLTGQPFGGEEWDKWMEWYGNNAAEYRPPSRYLEWKTTLYGQIDSRFVIFLRGTEDTAQIDYTEVVWGGVEPDGIPDLRNPTHVEGTANGYLAGHERVFGLNIDGDARAYPLRIVNAHEMVNDVVGGVPVALSWCTLCGSGIAYHSIVNGVPTTFGTSGFLYRNNKLMYDRATNTLWNQQTGVPVLGELAGSGVRLDFLPMALTTWEEWLERHPDTKVLSLETGYYSPRLYQAEEDEASIYFAYRQQTDTMFPQWARDDRLEIKDEVLGIELDGDKKAYPVELLKQVRIVNDSVGGVELVVIGSALSSELRAYRTEGLTFTLSPDTPLSLPETLIDSNGSRWRVTLDALVSEDEPDRMLARVPANVAFWLGWYGFHQETEVYGADGP